MKLVQLTELLLCLVISCVQQNPQEDICKGLPDGQFVGDPSDCSRFYMCDNGFGTGANCPAGMLFDTLQNRCNFEHDVDCGVATEPEETTTVPTTATSEEIETTTNAASDVDEFCRSTDPSVPSFYPSSTNCEEYYICVNQKPFRLSCARGQHWNQQKRYCDDPAAVDCLVDVPPVEFEKCPTKGHAFFPHPEICEFFLFCDSGELSVQMCPFYYQWDSSHETCVLKHISDCTKSSVSDVKWN
ncbi:peritrophin-1-like [Ochlerotatus camptorhynchus]|uniref:peritrophin-1-like n=1 Tax=Ochlerotatus camptorhynchus TaxID=644619 RepID=UPI0031DA370D